MSTEAFTRAPRRAQPALPTGEVVLEPPPAIAAPTGARWQQWLSVVPMLGGTAATALMFGGRQSGGTYTYVVGAIFGLSTLGLLLTTWSGATGPRRAELVQARRDYLRYLASTRRRVRAVIEQQREALSVRHPSPESLWEHAGGRRVWERGIADADFGVVRVGVGPQTLATPLVAPSIDPAADLEPVTAGALRRFLDAYSVVPDLPVCVALRSFTQLTIVDPRDVDGRGLARSVLAQLATFHSPADLIVIACVAPTLRAEWEWLKWLPHALHPSRGDTSGARRLVVTDLADLDHLAADLTSQRRVVAQPPTARRAEATAGPHIVVLVDGVDVTLSTVLGRAEALGAVTVIEVGRRQPPGAEPTTIILTVGNDGALASSTVDGLVPIGRADLIGIPTAEALARRLAPLRLAERASHLPLTTEPHLPALLGIAHLATADLTTLWAPRSPRDLLRVPIGTAPDGTPVELDLKEAAEAGMGPHGLIVGATGSGKSELLRTLVVGLAATHSSRALNFVLIDFKGGATFASLDRLPHTSAVITNLANELPLVDRMNDALTGELTRRQELLRRAGNVTSVRDYERVRAGGAALPPVPVLLVVCDEFTELLAARPELIELFLQIGRVGRSLAVHLLLATQRLEEGRLRGLDSNLSYRIALRTFSTAESRMLLGVPDAAELPSAPGHGYLKVGTEPLRRFTAAYVSGAYLPTVAAPSGLAARVRPYSTHAALPIPLGADVAPVAASVGGATVDGPRVLDVLLERVSGRGTPAHRVWLPPLTEAPTLDQLLGELTVEPVRGMTTVNPALRGALRIPLSIVDVPVEQRRDVGWLDLSGTAGHLAIVGSPQTGKSTALRTIVMALALTHTPDEVAVYGLDFGGGSLTTLKDLPHVGDVAGRLDTALVRRCVGDMAALLAERERRFADMGIDSMATLRRLRRGATATATATDRFGDVFLIVDGWATLRSDFDDLEPVLTDLATRGLSFGVHLVATASRWHDFRTVRDLFGSRVELRLGDPADSAIDRRAASNVPLHLPGRGLSGDRLQILTALPHTAEHPTTALAKHVAAAWSGPRAPAVRMLASVVPYTSLTTGAPTSDGRPGAPLGTALEIPLGIGEADLRPMSLDFAVDAHLIAFGDAGCGKSSLLRGIAESVARRFRPDQARIVIVDYRRSLADAVSAEHLIGHGTTAANTIALIESVASYMDRRRPGPDVTAAQLRERSWWTGPECFVLIDDYDLVVNGPTNPIAPLLDHLAHARDVGLHLILTRRAGGAARAQYEPVLQRLRELGTPTLVMAGDREEGALVGSVRPGPLPAGRGHLVTRRDGVRLMQLAFLEPQSARAHDRGHAG